MNDYLDKTAGLIPAARRVICDKETERPMTGEPHALTLTEMGTYLCRRCGLALFRAIHQFHSGCGWPSFDTSLQSVKQQLDTDGKRTEILCQRCDAHLGHVFVGEQFTSKNIRHCVNSIALDFVTDSEVEDSEEAIVAGGCFWGVEYFLRLLPGVLNVEVGYSGGNTLNPSYDPVCCGDTGHYEAARVLYDRKKINYSAVLQRFFEIHDPTQRSGQGLDIGPQYKSAVFYYNDNQHDEAEQLIQQLRSKGYDVVTRLIKVQPFWPAEEHHQNYYAKHQKIPYCHKRETRFD